MTKLVFWVNEAFLLATARDGICFMLLASGDCLVNQTTPHSMERGVSVIWFMSRGGTTGSMSRSKEFN